eukprot:ANDGO_06314.mRNA.1 hypothetical protein
MTCCVQMKILGVAVLVVIAVLARSAAAADWTASICPSPPCSFPVSVSEDMLTLSVNTYTRSNVSVQVLQNSPFQSGTLQSVSVPDDSVTEVEPVNIFGHGYNFLWSTKQNGLFRFNQLTSTYVQVPYDFSAIGGAVKVTALCWHYNYPSVVYVVTNSNLVGTLGFNVKHMTLNGTILNFFGDGCVPGPAAYQPFDTGTAWFVAFQGTTLRRYTPSAHAVTDTFEAPEPVVKLSQGAKLFSTGSRLYVRQSSGFAYAPYNTTLPGPFQHFCPCPSSTLSVWVISGGVLLGLDSKGVVGYNVTTSNPLVYGSCNMQLNAMFVVESDFTMHRIQVGGAVGPSSPPDGLRVVSYDLTTASFTCDRCSPWVSNILYVTAPASPTGEILYFGSLNATNLTPLTEYWAYLSQGDSYLQRTPAVFGTGPPLGAPSNVKVVPVWNSQSYAYDYSFSWEAPTVLQGQTIAAYVVTVTDTAISWLRNYPTSSADTAFTIPFRQFFGDFKMYSVLVSAVSQELGNVGDPSVPVEFNASPAVMSAPRNLAMDTYATGSLFDFVFRWDPPSDTRGQAISSYNVRITDLGEALMKAYTTTSTSFQFTYESLFGDGDQYSIMVVAVTPDQMASVSTDELYFNLDGPYVPPKHNDGDDSKSTFPVGAIVGIAIGGAAVVGAAFAYVFLRSRRLRTGSGERQALI